MTKTFERIILASKLRRIKAELQKQLRDSPLKKERDVYLAKYEDDNLILESCNSQTSAKQVTSFKSKAGKIKQGDVVVSSGTTKDGRLIINKIIGNEKQKGIEGLISMYEHDIKLGFSDAAMKQAYFAQVPELGNREDLRSLPLITIDPVGSEDLDDAIYAEKKPDGGYKLIIAIADVAHFVRPGSPLDIAAKLKGNTTYLPHKAIHMLPKKLSAEACSLLEGMDRACLACHVEIDKNGKLQDYYVTRAMMNSAARLTYQQAQEAYEGKPNYKTDLLVKDVINPLFDAADKLDNLIKSFFPSGEARKEYEMIFSREENPIGVREHQHYRSNEVVANFALVANHCVAKMLKGEGIYRVHPEPKNIDKLVELVDNLSPESKAKELSVKDVFNCASGLLLDKNMKKNLRTKLIRTMCAVQLQAEYKIENGGHFGLGLSEYVHFTSPIRRNPDIEVHRILIDKFNLGDDGMSFAENKDLFKLVAKSNSISERKSDRASNAAFRRYHAKMMEKHVSEISSARVEAISGKGIRILTADDTTAFVPIALIDKRAIVACNQNGCNRIEVFNNRGRQIKKGSNIKVILAEADRFRGRLSYKLGYEYKDNPVNREQLCAINDKPKAESPKLAPKAAL